MPNQNSKIPSLTGLRFGAWTVGESSIEPDGKQHKVRMYTCTCDCGTKQKVSHSHLSRGKSTQCLHCRSTKEICIRGHVIALIGRNSSGGCRLCAKETNLRYKYGLSVEEYVALYNHQDGKCAICKKPLELVKTTEERNKLGRAEVDHLHIPKKQKTKPSKKSTVRGLLCGGRWAGCNAKLGRVDKPEWLKAALEYVTNPPAKILFERNNDRG